MTFTSKFNWIDILAFIVLVRILYIAVSKGFVVEFFKCIATFLSLSFSFHYFTYVTDLLVRFLPFLNENTGYALSLIALYGLVWTLIKYVRTAIILLFKIEPHAVIERWVGLFLGLARGAVFLSVLFFTLYLFHGRYVNNSLMHSFSFSAVKQIAPASYRTMCGFYATFLPGLKPNEAVDKVY